MRSKYNYELEKNHIYKCANLYLQITVVIIIYSQTQHAA